MEVRSFSCSYKRDVSRGGGKLRNQKKKKKDIFFVFRAPTLQKGSPAEKERVPAF